MNFSPTAKRVLLKPVIEEKSVILLPTEEVRTPTFQVAKTGPECQLVSKGDTVIIGKYSGDELTIDDKKYILLKSEEGILAKIVYEG